MGHRFRWSVSIWAVSFSFCAIFSFLCVFWQACWYPRGLGLRQPLHRAGKPAVSVANGCLTGSQCTYEQRKGVKIDVIGHAMCALSRKKFTQMALNGPFWLEFLLDRLLSDAGVDLLLPEPALALAAGLVSRTGVFQSAGWEPSLARAAQPSPPVAVGIANLAISFDNRSINCSRVAGSNSTLAKSLAALSSPV